VDTSNKSRNFKTLYTHCLVSALAGLRETVIDTQKNILDAAVQANVQRFIPSDYSTDFTNLKRTKSKFRF
jgi:hypothetical protein